MAYHSDVTFDFRGPNGPTMEVHHRRSEPWRVTIVDTGEKTQTGGRLKRIQSYVGGETFCATYGDGLGDIDINALIAFHRGQGRLATLTAVQPMGRYGALDIGERDLVRQFHEKPVGDGGWINGGFFVLEPQALDYIRLGDETQWERQPMERLTEDGQLVAYKHYGFWRPMDTLRDKRDLEALWVEGRAPWDVWSVSPSKEDSANARLKAA